MKRSFFAALLLSLTLMLTACPAVNDYTILELNSTVPKGVVDKNITIDAIAGAYMLGLAYIKMPTEGFTAEQEACMESSNNPLNCLSDEFYIDYYFNNAEWTFEDMINELVLEYVSESYYVEDFMNSLESETNLVLDPVLLRYDWGRTETVANAIRSRMKNSVFMDEFKGSFVEEFRKFSTPTTDVEAILEQQFVDIVNDLTVQMTAQSTPLPTQPPQTPQYTPLPQTPQYTQPPQIPQYTQPPQIPQYTQSPQIPQYTQSPQAAQQLSDCGGIVSIKAAEWSPPREWTINKARSSYMVSELNAASQYELLDTLARAVLVEHMLVDMWSIQVHAYRDPLMYNPFKYMDSWDYPLAYYFYNTGRTLSEWWAWTVENSEFLSLGLNPRGYIEERAKFSDVHLSPSVLSYAWRNEYIQDYVAQRITDDSFVLSIKMNFRQTFERLWDRVYAYNSFIADYDYVQDECPPVQDVTIQETPQSNISVILNNRTLDMGSNAEIRNGRVMGYLYAIAGILGDEVINISEDGRFGVAYTSSGGGRPIVRAEIYENLSFIKVIYENGEQSAVSVDVPAYRNSNGVIMVSLEHFAQAVGATFLWDSQTQTVILTWLASAPMPAPSPTLAPTPVPTAVPPMRFGN